MGVVRPIGKAKSDLMRAGVQLDRALGFVHAAPEKAGVFGERGEDQLTGLVDLDGRIGVAVLERFSEVVEIRPSEVGRKWALAIGQRPADRVLGPTDVPRRARAVAGGVR